MKRCLTILAFVSLPLVAMAESNPPGAKMSLVDAAKLDAAFAHEQLIMQKAQQDAAPFEREIQRICKQYGIDPAQLGKAVGVDPTTGAIQRAPTPAPAAAAKK